MHAWVILFGASLLCGQEEKPVPKPQTQTIRLGTPLQTPQEVLRAMVAQDQARRGQPGATVEVIGYDDEIALKLLGPKVADKARLEFRNIDKLQHQELYTFIHQDPSHPSPVLIIPALAGGPKARAEDKWLK